MNENKFVCPITFDILQDPVTIQYLTCFKGSDVASTCCYERESLLSWLSSSNTCPKTRQPVSRLIDANEEFVKELRDFRKKNGLDTKLLEKKPLQEWNRCSDCKRPCLGTKKEQLENTKMSPGRIRNALYFCSHPMCEYCIKKCSNGGCDNCQWFSIG